MVRKAASSHSTDIFMLISGKDFRLKVFFEGIVVGVGVGLVISAFRYLLEKAEDLRIYSYTATENSGWEGFAVRLIIMVLLAGIISTIIRIAPQTAGSGIVQVKGFLLGQVKLKWLRNLLGKFFGTIIAIGAGLSLGRQGPAIQMGASIGQGISRMLGRLRVEEKYLVTSGAGAGLAAAFNAPLAGVVFALEEVHKSFSPAALMSTMGAALSADFVMRQFFGTKPVLDISGIPILPQKYYLLLLGLGIFCGIIGVLFNRFLILSYKFYSKLNSLFFPKLWTPLIPLVMAAILGYYLPQVLGGGESFITSLAKHNYALSFLLVVILVKFAFTMLSAASGAPGGLFLPMLVLGALAGNIYGNIIGSTELIPNFVVFAMAALFTAVVKAPITGSILITEMTGSFQHLLPVIIVCMVAYLISDLLKTEPIYDDLYRLTVTAPEEHKKTKIKETYLGENSNLQTKEGGKEVNTAKESYKESGKTVIEEVVCSRSSLQGKKIKNIDWPPGCLIISIRRGEEEMIPRGDTTILAGDFLYILVDHVNESELQGLISELCKEKL